jgi:hypothetical protein
MHLPVVGGYSLECCLGCRQPNNQPTTGQQGIRTEGDQR